MGSEKRSLGEKLLQEPEPELEPGGSVQVVQKVNKPTLPLVRKLCFAVGGAPYQMTGNAIGFFLQIFLLDVVQMETFYASLILFIGRAWDAFTDPVVGFLVSKSRRTRFGKLLPWTLFSMPFGIASYFLLWFSPSYTMSWGYSFFWYLMTYCAFHTCMSKWAYMVAAIVIISLYFLCSLILLFGVKEQTGWFAHTESFQMSYLTGLKLLTSHKPYLYLTFGYLCISLAFQVVQNNFALFCTHAAGLGSHLQHIVFVILVSAAISVPVWQWVLVKLGKKRTLFVGLIWYIPPLITIATVNDNLPVIIVMAIATGFSLAVAFLLPWSMLPDVVDDFHLKNPHCLDLEPLFYSFYVFFTKFATGVSLGFSTLCLHFSGYRPSSCENSPAVAVTLKVLIAPVPIILVMISLTIFYFYPINEKRRRELKAELDRVVKSWEVELEENTL
ncbi:sodium-dependent lysophosphatidylcholine symporter 1-like isoform X3 [Narcine bancroftii]|uniref:sodium-dependent lysophosphatidylcholine symporter 1-like isoform X3 n=1 Tax=Narcine bancroftii TaxID=1343680 RepID=UPI003831CAD2